MLDHLIMLGPVRQNEPPPQRHRPPGQTFIYDSAEMADLSRIQGRCLRRPGSRKRIPTYSPKYAAA